MMRFLLILLATTILSSIALAQTTRSDLQNQNNTQIIANGIGAISGDVLNSMLGNIILSIATLDDTNTFSALQTFSLNPSFSGCAGFITGNGSSPITCSTTLPSGLTIPLATLSNPTLTGTPTAPTASPGTNSTQIATTAFVASLAANCISGGSISSPLVANGSGGCTTVSASTLINGVLTLGSSGTLGSVTMGNATSGTLTLSPSTGALGTVTATFPINTGRVAELNLAQTWTALQTLPGLPGLSANVASAGVPGLALPETNLATSQWFIFAAPTLSSTSISGNPAFYLQRNPSGSGGTLGSVSFAMNLLDIVPSGDNYYEWGLQVTLENGALSSNGVGSNSPENVGLSVQSAKIGTSSQDISATWGILIQATDPTGFASPTTGLTGMELDIGAGSGPAQPAVNGGVDPNHTRIGLQIVGNGLSGTHVYTGIEIGFNNSGGTFDNGICFGTACNGGQGSISTAINLNGTGITTGISMGGNDILFSGPVNQWIMQTQGSGSANYLDIAVNGVTDVFHIAGSNGAVTIGTPVLLSGLPTSAGGSGLYVCVDSTGALYKKSSCP